MESRFILPCLLASALGGLSAASPDSGPVETQPASGPAGLLAGFTASPHFGEQVLAYRFEPGVQVLINAPAPERSDPARPTRVLFYALPNGNTTAQTVGRKMEPGLDWHYDIQHIGAQARLLRDAIADANLVVVYLEADGRSWPAWKGKHPGYRQIIPRVLESVRDRLPSRRCTFELSGHSGGGSFVLGYLDSAEQIHAEITRISFLDSNYGYTDAAHGVKLAAWLKGGAGRVLSVICYDDRDVKLDGKPIVSPTGGTYRRTLEMVERLGKDFPLTRTVEGDVIRHRGLDGRIELILVENPRGKILHTVLVGEMNGFAHAMVVGTSYENKIAPFGPPRAYTAWIQPE